MTQDMRSFYLDKAKALLLSLRCKEQTALKAYQSGNGQQHDYAMARHDRVYFESLSQDQQIAKVQ